jgi:hypothetical protein
MDSTPRTAPRPSATFDEVSLSEIRRASATGIYDIRGFGAKRKVPHFDDLLFLGASISRYPLEGYREKCATDVWLGTRFAEKPIHIKIPITIAGMSFGSLSAQAKEALGRGASKAGTSTTTGDGGMTNEEREHSTVLVYQLLPSRYGMNPDDLRRCDAIEIVIGQGAKPGGGGMLLGLRVAPVGVIHVDPRTWDRPRRGPRRFANDHGVTEYALGEFARSPALATAEVCSQKLECSLRHCGRRLSRVRARAVTRVISHVPIARGRRPSECARALLASTVEVLDRCRCRRWNRAD